MNDINFESIIEDKLEEIRHQLTSEGISCVSRCSNPVKADFVKKTPGTSTKRNSPDDPLSYNPDEVWMYDQLYTYAKHYIYEHELYNAALSLVIVRALLDGIYRATATDEDGSSHPQPLFTHCLSVCKMLIDLNPQLTHDEEDIAIATALCHELCGYLVWKEGGLELIRDYGLDHRIVDIVSLLTRGRYMTDQERPAFFSEVEQNKLALLVRLADRGNIVEQLYNVSVFRAHEYIYETRTYYFPMCIYAKENYPELDSVVALVMEKMRCLIDVTEILVGRYEKREMELTNEILTLKEENARIRKILRRHAKA